MHARSRFGAAGENLAATYLTARGYTVIDRNVRTPFGELDLVCRHGREIVFVEVKARRSRAFGAPEEAVTAAKQGHLIRAAQAYLTARSTLRTAPHRIDVIAITWRVHDTPEIVHIVNAVAGRRS